MEVVCAGVVNLRNDEVMGGRDIAVVGEWENRHGISLGVGG